MFCLLCFHDKSQRHSFIFVFNSVILAQKSPHEKLIKILFSNKLLWTHKYKCNFNRIAVRNEKSQILWRPIFISIALLCAVSFAFTILHHASFIFRLLPRTIWFFDTRNWTRWNRLPGLSELRFRQVLRDFSTQRTCIVIFYFKNFLLKVQLFRFIFYYFWLAIFFSKTMIINRCDIRLLSMDTNYVYVSPIYHTLYLTKFKVKCHLNFHSKPLILLENNKHTDYYIKNI
jgi:hypothetical protein